MEVLLYVECLVTQMIKAAWEESKDQLRLLTYEFGVSKMGEYESSEPNKNKNKIKSRPVNVAYKSDTKTMHCKPEHGQVKVFYANLTAMILFTPIKYHNSVDWFLENCSFVMTESTIC